MSPGDIAQLTLIAQGEGEVRLSKRALRGLLAEITLCKATHRAQDMIGRTLRSPS